MKNSVWVGILILILGIVVYGIAISQNVQNLPLRAFTVILFIFGILFLIDGIRAIVKKKFTAYIPHVVVLFPSPFWLTKKKLSKKRAKFAIIFNIFLGVILLLISSNLYQQW